MLPENQNPAEEEDNPDNDHVIESPVENGEQEEFGTGGKCGKSGSFIRISCR